MSILTRIRTWLVGRADEGGRPPDTTTDAGPQSSVTVIDLAESHAAHRDGARFVDVREPAEWAQGHIAGAVHYPVASVEADPRLSVAQDAQVVAYCAAGARAARAAASLAANGYTDVRALQGGYADWQKAGYPVEVPANDDERA